MVIALSLPLLSPDPLFAVRSTNDSAHAYTTGGKLDPRTAVSNTGLIYGVPDHRYYPGEIRLLSSEKGKVRYIPGSTGTRNTTNIEPDAIIPSRIIGDDNRTIITDTTVIPYRMIARLEASFPGTQVNCSGWLYGDDMVATAGHCVYRDGKWASSVDVIPGKNDLVSETEPYSRCRGSVLYSTTGWTVDKDYSYDYGAIRLGCKIGETTGWLGVEVVEAPNYMQVMLSGYPSDKGGEQQWLSPGTVASSTYTLLHYTNDTVNASSGSTVYRDAERCGGPCVIASVTS